MGRSRAAREPPKGGVLYGSFNCSRRLSSASRLRMYSRIVASSRPTVDTKYPRAQKCCPTKFRFLVEERPGNVNRALPLDVPDDLRDRVLRWDRDLHVHVVRHQVALDDLALLLLRQGPEDITHPAQFPIQRLLPVLRDEHHVVFAAHTLWLRLS